MIFCISATYMFVRTFAVNAFPDILIKDCFSFCKVNKVSLSVNFSIKPADDYGTL